MDDKTPERLIGCPGGCGGPAQGGQMIARQNTAMLFEAPIEKIIPWSPQLALARATGTSLVPWTPQIKATFQTSASPIGPFAWTDSTGEAVKLWTFGVVDMVVFQIDCPGNNSGLAIKPLTDFFFGLQSGIEATMDMTGDPKFVVAPDFTPLRNLVAMLNEPWPQGWILGWGQALRMQFNISQAALVQNFPLTVTVTWRLLVPNVGTAKGKRFHMLTERQAWDDLERLGFDCSKSRAAADWCTV